METLKLPDFFFYLSEIPGKEKITIGPIDDGKHLTFHCGTKSKTFDIHITDENNGSYETIIAIRYFSLYRLYSLIKNDIFDLIKETYSYHINLGKLRKNNCFLTPIQVNNDYSKILKSNTKKNRFRLIKSINIEELSSFFIELDDIDNNCDIFFVHKIRKNRPVPNGLIYRRLDRVTQNSFIYLSKKRQHKLKTGIIKILLENIAKVQNLECEKLLNALKS